MHTGGPVRLPGGRAHRLTGAAHRAGRPAAGRAVPSTAGATGTAATQRTTDAREDMP